MGEQALGEKNRLIAPVLVAGAVALGVFMPVLSNALFPFIFVALFLVVLFSLCNLDRCPTEVMFTWDRFTLKLVAWQLILLPSLLLLLTRYVQIPDAIVAMMLATMTAGSVFASPALVKMVGLDRDQATKSMVVSTVIMPFSMLVFGTLLGILPWGLSLDHYIGQINFFLIIPMILALFYWSAKHKLTPQFERRLSKGFSWGSTLALMVFCIGAMHSITIADYHELVRVLSYGVVAILLAALLFSITAMAFAGHGPQLAVLAGMLTANRNVALAAAFLDQAATPDLMVYVAVSQFPIFLFPLILQLAKRTRGSVVHPEGSAGN